MPSLNCHTIGKTVLVNAKRSLILIIDLQTKLMPAINKSDSIVEHTKILIEAAKILEIPILVSEQYPQGLGPTIDSIRVTLPKSCKILSKLTFSAFRNPQLYQELYRYADLQRDQIIICGTESHVCVLQTVADLQSNKFKTFAVTDAIGSRTSENRAAGIDRMKTLGSELITTEMALFEWLEIAGTDNFKKLSKLIK